MRMGKGFLYDGRQTKITSPSACFQVVSVHAIAKLVANTWHPAELRAGIAFRSLGARSPLQGLLAGTGSEVLRATSGQRFARFAVGPWRRSPHPKQSALESLGLFPAQHPANAFTPGRTGS